MQTVANANSGNSSGSCYEKQIIETKGKNRIDTDWYTYWKEKGGLLNSAHRAHKEWKDYKGKGIYLITIVTHKRKHVFGELNKNIAEPRVELTKLGQYVEEAWKQTFEIQRSKGRQVCTLGYQVMPDHFHGIVQVEKAMDINMGTIIRDFKAVCTKEYRVLYPPRLEDKTIEGEGIRQSWRIDKKATNEQKTTNDNNGIYEKNIFYIISFFAALCSSPTRPAGSLERRRNG